MIYHTISAERIREISRRINVPITGIVNSMTTLSPLTDEQIEDMIRVAAILRKPDTLTDDKPKT